MHERPRFILVHPIEPGVFDRIRTGVPFSPEYKRPQRSPRYGVEAGGARSSKRSTSLTIPGSSMSTSTRMPLCARITS
jgi:hypothetical protein